MCFCFFKPQDGGNQTVAVMATFPRFFFCPILPWTQSGDCKVSGSAVEGYGPMDYDENQAYIYIYCICSDGWLNQRLGLKRCPMMGN